jgi:peroxiredoxin
MAIHVGDIAPDFTLKNQDDKEWKLSDHKGKDVVLLWYPLDWSPTCEKENCSLSTEPTLNFPNTVLVGISRDSMWSHRAWKKERGIQHDLLADPTLDVTRKYDLVHPAGFISHRATVVVDKQGKVAFVQVQEKTPEARDMAAVAGALKKLSA